MTTTNQARRPSQPPQDLEAKKYLVTLSQAKAEGISWRKEPPEPKKCKYCGAMIEPKGLILNGVIIIWQPGELRCDCAQAKAYWDAYDREQAKKQAAAIEAERKRQMQERIRRLTADSGIKKRFLNRTFENFVCKTQEQKRCYGVAKNYADNWETYKAGGTGLYIEGTNGTGKTHLAAAIALQLIGEGVPVIFKTGSDLLADIKRTFDSNTEISEYQVLDVYKKVDLLIIDDLGKEQCTDWNVSTLYNILNDRYESMRPTIITTNYGTEGLAQAMTPKGYDNTKIIAIISRLLETSKGLTMAWNDMRRS